MDVSLIQTVGLPVFALLAMGWGVWRTAEWVAGHLVIPMRDRHFEFLDLLSKTLDTIAKTQESMASEVKTISQVVLKQSSKE